MGKDIDIWKTARGILSCCENKEEISAIAEALRNKQTREKLINILVSVGKSLESPKALKTKMFSNVDETRYTPENILHNLFRDKLKMTNSEVEKWLENGFNIKRNTAKISLRGYLISILREDPVNIGKAIMSQAYRDFKIELGAKDDLQMFWDGLDARAKSDNNVNVQTRNSEFPSDNRKLRSVRDE